MLKRAYFLVLPNVHVLDLAGPLQIIATLRELGLAQVSVECIGPRPTVQAFQNVALREIRPLPPRLVKGDMLFVIGSKLDDVFMRSQPWNEAVEWLRSRATDIGSALHVCGICTGTFLLAQAGLLDGKVCTTHHHFVCQLRHRFPDVHVVENRVLVRDGTAWTSAGVACGIDLALHVIAQTYGDDAAIQVARENVVDFRRFGNDPELSAQLRYRAHGNQLVHAAQDAIGKSLSTGVTCQAVVHGFGVSYRHLARAFVAEAGITMKRYQLQLRMELARRLVVDSKLTLERVVERCGFGSVQAFRANWDKHEVLSPSELRKHAKSRRA